MKRAAFFWLAACHQTSDVPPRTVETTDASEVSASPSIEDPVAVLDAWNKALNGHDSQALDAVYAEDVQFYGAHLSRAACVERNARLFASKSDFRQELVGIEVVERSASHVRATFLKNTWAKGAQGHYAGHAVLRESGGRWAIAEESDDLTDANTPASSWLDLPAKDCGGDRWMKDDGEDRPRAPKTVKVPLTKALAAIPSPETKLALFYAYPALVFQMLGPKDFVCTAHFPGFGGAYGFHIFAPNTDEVVMTRHADGATSGRWTVYPLGDRSFPKSG